MAAPARFPLSDAQRRAVERSGQDVCVVAGPGSGKTRVLAERFAWLVEECGVDPARILAITFTEKSAAEIRRRLVTRFAASADLRETVERAWVSTIDAFCARLLRQQAAPARVPPEFTVLDQGTADRMLDRAAEDALDELYRDRPAAFRRLLDALDLASPDDLASGLTAVYTRMRVEGPLPGSRGSESEESRPAEALELARQILRDTSTGTSANQRIAIAALRAWASELLELAQAPLAEEHFALRAGLGKVHRGRLVKHSAARAAVDRLKQDALADLEAAWLAELHAESRALLAQAVERIGHAYESAKRAEDSLDFADLAWCAVRLLEQAPQARFDHVLMDELQDTNRLHWRLVNLLRGSFFGVGDPNQSIYGFRGADLSVFREYRSQVASSGGAIDELAENYRSRPEILGVVSRVFRGVAGVEERELLAKRAPARVRGSGPVLERLVGRGERAQEVEAALVASRIREFTDSGDYALSEIAVLVRTLAPVELLGKVFERFGIPYLVSGGRTFLEAREIRDVLALLAALVNPLDEIPLVGVLRGPLGGLSDEEIFGLEPQGWQAAFEARFGSIRRLAGFLPPDLLVARALDQRGFTAALGERPRANVDKLLGWLRREYRRKPRPLAELLEDLEALRRGQTEAEAPPPDTGDAVRIMTIHQAKGLEFPVVFLSAMDRGTNTRRPAIAYSPKRGIGAKWRNPATGAGQSDAIRAAVAEEVRTREEGEENRLLYVAMTRAEERLILSYAERKKPLAWVKLAEAAVAGCTEATEPHAPPPPPARALESGAAVLLDPPVVREQFDSIVPASGAALFRLCPRRYFLGRYLKLEPAGVEPESGAALEIEGVIVTGRPEPEPETVRALREAQETLVFPLKPGRHCLQCPFYRGSCPAQPVD